MEERIESLLGTVANLVERVEELERQLAEFRPKHMKFDVYGAEEVASPFTEDDFIGR